MHIKFKKTLIFIILVLVGIAGWYYNNQRALTYSVPQSRTATVFIPGLGGNYVTSDYMTSSWNKSHVATRTLQVYVKNNGDVKTVKQFHKVGKNNPVIQASFQTNNKPGFEGSRMPYLMRYLHNKYGIDKVNLIGHSSGGTIIYDYLTRYNHTKDVPETMKFVSMADTYPHSDPKYINNLPKNLEVLNFCGNIANTGSDGLIPVKDIKPFGKLLKGHVKSYKFYVYHGDQSQAQHSMLHENPQINKIIANFLFK